MGGTEETKASDDRGGRVAGLTRRFLSRTGDLLEQRIESGMERGDREVPILPEEPENGKWYRLPMEEGISGDGSDYHIYLKYGRADRLCLFLSGGGMAWDEYSAARPVTGARLAAGLPNYYWNNLRPVTEIINIYAGIMDGRKQENAFADWSFVVITYTTGDFHVGDSTLQYTDEDGTGRTLYFHGRKNFLMAMEEAVKRFPSPQKLLIAGDSAGAFAVPALAGEIAADYYPDCPDVTLLSDSALLEFKDWQHTLRDVWKAPRAQWEPVVSSNIVLDWYRKLLQTDLNGRKLRCLYASSVEDYLLSSYWNEFLGGKFETGPEIRSLFRNRLGETVKGLAELDPSFGFFIYDWKNPLYTKGGTVHTAVRLPYFYWKTKSGATMAEWLADAVDGKVRSEGMELIASGEV